MSREPWIRIAEKIEMNKAAARHSYDESVQASGLNKLNKMWAAKKAETEVERWEDIFTRAIAEKNQAHRFLAQRRDLNLEPAGIRGVWFLLHL